jgi:hypothetical protein
LRLDLSAAGSRSRQICHSERGKPGHSERSEESRSITPDRSFAALRMTGKPGFETASTETHPFPISAPAPEAAARVGVFKTKADVDRVWHGLLVGRSLPISFAPTAPPRIAAPHDFAFEDGGDFRNVGENESASALRRHALSQSERRQFTDDTVFEFAGSDAFDEDKIDAYFSILEQTDSEDLLLLTRQGSGT